MAMHLAASRLGKVLLAVAICEPVAGLQRARPAVAFASPAAASRTSAAVAPLVARLHTTLLASVMAASLCGTPAALAAAGSVAKLDLDVQSYAEVACPEALAQGRAGGSLGAGAGGAGIAQKCVQVKATTDNDTGKKVELAGVFGRVEGIKDGMSVLGNGQDGKNDAGQFAMIDVIKPGKQDVEFIFVAQQATTCVDKRVKDPETGKVQFVKCPVQGTEPLVALKFEKVKAIAYPSGDRFKLYDECEQNEFAEGC